MRLQIKSSGFELTPSLKTLIEEKMHSLSKFLVRWDADNGILLRVEVAKTTKHHLKGNVFYAEATLDVPHKVIRVEETSADIHAAIETLKDRLKKEVLRLKEKETDHS